MLSRKNTTIGLGDKKGSASAFSGIKPYQGIGLTNNNGTSGLGNSTYLGAYLMTQGKIPQLRLISSNNILGTYIAQAVEAWLQNPSEWLWRYKTTGEEEYLNKAITFTDKYVLDRVKGLYDEIPNDSDFIYQKYFPNFNCLLEMYEELKDKPGYEEKANEYLEAAEESARRLLAVLWKYNFD